MSNWCLKWLDQLLLSPLVYESSRCSMFLPKCFYYCLAFATPGGVKWNPFSCTCHFHDSKGRWASFHAFIDLADFLSCEEPLSVIESVRIPEGNKWHPSWKIWGDFDKRLIYKCVDRTPPQVTELLPLTLKGGVTRCRNAWQIRRPQAAPEGKRCTC